MSTKGTLFKRLEPQLVIRSLKSHRFDNGSGGQRESFFYSEVRPDVLQFDIVNLALRCGTA